MKERLCESGRARHGRRKLRQRRILDEARGRADRVPPLPALLPYAGRPARPLLRAPRARGRRGHGAHRLRPLDRLLRRSDREEAAQPLPAGLVGAVVRHGRLQPRLRLLPELGHLQEPRDGAPQRGRHARHDRARRGALGVRQRRLHLQRPGHFHGIRGRHGGRLPGARDQERRGDRGLHLRRAAQALVRRAWTRPTSISRPSPSASTRSAARASSSRCSRR